MEKVHIGRQILDISLEILVKVSHMQSQLKFCHPTSEILPSHQRYLKACTIEFVSIPLHMNLLIFGMLDTIS